MFRVLLLGAGKIGRAIARMLAHEGLFEILVGDVDARALARVEDLPNVRTRRLDVTSQRELEDAATGCRAVVSACSFAVNPTIARAALAVGASYFDLTEDVETTREVRRVSAEARAGQIFMPQCGLAPGFINIAGFHLTQGFDKLDEVRLRVGALPKFPSNVLKYNLTWSTDGLINEYCNPCEVIHEGKKMEVLPLEGLEHFSLDGVAYEAFNTSGGVGSLSETLAQKVRTLDYKTVRYAGHRDLVDFLVNGLRLGTRRALLKDILENAVPITLQDVVLTFVTVTGWKDGTLTQVTDARKVYHGVVHGEPWSAIQITTAAGLCAVLDLHREGALPERGFVPQERVSLDAFLANRFGRRYVQHGQSTLSPL
jgi:saccharopine dehydrogenase-like NADP-dependent oxidoreductase